MAESFIQLNTDGSGKEVRAENITVGLNSVYMEVQCIADPTTAANVAAVSAAGALKVDGSAVTQPVSIAAAAAGGFLDFHLVSAGSTNQNNIKASPGQVYGWSIFNNATYPVYVKLYNTAGTPTAGTGVVQTIGIQAGLSSVFSSDLGRAFSTGIGLSITKGIADSDSVAVLANDCVVDIFYA